MAPLAHLAQHGEPVQPRHAPVEQHRVDLRILAQMVQGVLAAVGAGHVIALVQQIMPERLAEQRVVIDQE